MKDRPHLTLVPNDAALGVFELGSIARGVVVTDAIAKKAPVTLIASRPVSGGKFLVFFRGQVAEVEESFEIGREVAGRDLKDALFLSAAHESLFEFIPDPVTANLKDSEGSVMLVETETVCRSLSAADVALKAAGVKLCDMRLAVGIHGKAIFSLAGPLPDIEAARAAVAEREGEGARIEVIAAPAGEIAGRLFF